MSARSEFEILCGIPEVEPLGDITFNYLGGKKQIFVYQVYYLILVIKV